MKVNANSLKIGNLIKYSNELWTIIKLNHVKPGKGGAFIQAELKNLKDKRKLNERFRSSETIERVILEEKKCSYLYADNSKFVFMDVLTYDQIEIEGEIIGEQSNYLDDGMEVTINFHEKEVTSINLPETCEVEVLSADAVIKGQTVSSSFKPAMIKNNIKIMVPAHIETGSRIIVKPSDSTYVEKAKI